MRELVKQFEHAGLQCHIYKIAGLGIGSLSGGWHCGYVDVPGTHPLHGKHYDDVNVDVHGGLTYSDNVEENESWRFGFDTAHHGDGAAEQSLNYLTAQCIKLADQLVAARLDAEHEAAAQ